jgi:hypothetical protein
MDFDLSNADASFLGEDAEDESGYSVAPAGDVNGDNLDDILIGAWGDEEGGDLAGQTYLILGEPKPSRPPPVPAVSQWGMIGAAALMAALLAWHIRRRWVASTGRGEADRARDKVI